MFKLTKNGEWAQKSDALIYVGLAQSVVDDLGDVTFVSLPTVGQTVAPQTPAATIEAVKAATDFYSPVSGVVVKINEELVRSPEKLNVSPEKDGWLFAVRDEGQTEFDSLLTKEEWEVWQKGQV